MTVVGRPPVLRCGHHRLDVPLQRIEVEGLELLGVVEVLAHGVGDGGGLVQNLQVRLIRHGNRVTAHGNVIRTHAPRQGRSMQPLDVEWVGADGRRVPGVKAVRSIEPHDPSFGR